MENAEQELDVLDVLMEKLVEKPPGVKCFSVEGFSVEAAIVEGLPLFDALVGQLRLLFHQLPLARLQLQILWTVVNLRLLLCLQLQTQQDWLLFHQLQVL